MKKEVNLLDRFVPDLTIPENQLSIEEFERDFCSLAGPLNPPLFKPEPPSFELDLDYSQKLSRTVSSDNPLDPFGMHLPLSTVLAQEPTSSTNEMKIVKSEPQEIEEEDETDEGTLLSSFPEEMDTDQEAPSHQSSDEEASDSDSEDSDYDEETDTKHSKNVSKSPSSETKVKQSSSGSTVPLKRKGASTKKSSKKSRRSPSSEEAEEIKPKRVRSGMVQKERKKPGRKPKILDEETRRERGRIRQEKNRIAARKCREKKQQYYSELETEVIGLRTDNQRLNEEVQQLKEQLKLLIKKETR